MKHASAGERHDMTAKLVGLSVNRFTNPDTATATRTLAVQEAFADGTCSPATDPSSPSRPIRPAARVLPGRCLYESPVTDWTDSRQQCWLAHA